VSYRVSDARPEAARQWYVASQLWADTALLALARDRGPATAAEDPGWDAADATCYLDKGFVFLDRLWDFADAGYFDYDQGLAIEAELQARRLDGDPSRLRRAEQVGRALHQTFWSDELGGYRLEAGVEQVYAAYGAWSSLGHLALVRGDADERWLALARANADVLAERLGEPDGGYAYRAYRCVDTVAPGCRDGPATVVVDHTRDTAAQAWVQHLQEAIAGAAPSQQVPARLPPA
jgi:hypothetical protein